MKIARGGWERQSRSRIRSRIWCGTGAAGARGLIEKTVEAELQGLLDQYENAIDLAGRQVVVRNGPLPERDILTAPRRPSPIPTGAAGHRQSAGRRSSRSQSPLGKPAKRLLARPVFLTNSRFFEAPIAGL